MIRRWNPGRWHRRSASTATSPRCRPAMSWCSISGQVGVLPDGTLAGAGAQAQTRQALANIELLLDSLGAGPQHLVKLFTLVAGAEHVEGCRTARAETFARLVPRRRLARPFARGGHRPGRPGADRRDRGHGRPAAPMSPEEFRALFPALRSTVWLDTPRPPPGAAPVTEALHEAAVRVVQRRVRLARVGRGGGRGPPAVRPADRSRPGHGVDARLAGRVRRHRGRLAAARPGRGGGGGVPQQPVPVAGAARRGRRTGPRRRDPGGGPGRRADRRHRAARRQRGDQQGRAAARPGRAAGGDRPGRRAAVRQPDAVAGRVALRPGGRTSRLPRRARLQVDALPRVARPGSSPARTGSAN